MKHHLLYCALLVAGVTLQARADDNPAGHAISPPMLQDQQLPEQLENQRMERDATNQAMTRAEHALVRQCRQLLLQQSKYPGPVHILSIKLVDDKGASFKGRFTEPDARVC